MEKTVQVPELKEEFHAVMEDIKPKNIMELEKMDNYVEPPLLRPENCIKVELGTEIIQEIITIMEDDDPDEIKILEVIDTSDVAPPVLSPNYGDSRHRRSPEVLEKGSRLLCRLCATRSNGMIDMFDPSEQHRNIVQKIEYCCLPIVVKKNDHLSTAACQLCLAKLELSYQFYKTVTEAKKLLTIREQTFKTLKTELIPDESIKKGIISDDLNDSDKCRKSNLSYEHQDADSSSNALDLSTKEVPITNVTIVNNVISADVNNVDEERTRSSNDERQRTDSTSNALIFSTEEALIIDATVENNIISFDGDNKDEEGTKGSNNERRKTDLASNTLNSSTKTTPTTNITMKKNIISPHVDNIGKDKTQNSSDTDRETDLLSNALSYATKKLSITDITAKKNNISSIVKNVDEDRTQSSSDKCRKTDPSSNTSNLRKATLQLKQATHSVLNDPMCPINSDKELSCDVERSDSDSPFPPVSRSRKASTDSRKNGTSGHHEQPSRNISGKQLSTHTEVNTHETKHQRSNDTSQLLPLQPISIKTESTVGMYYCKYCDEQCEGEINLLDHMRVHINEYPFTCSICDKAFKTRGHRNYHIVTHTRGEQFPCNTCNASFASKYALRAHEQSIHQEIKREDGGYRSRRKHRTSYSSSNTSNASKETYITDATVQNNVISSNLNTFEENNSNEHEKTNSSSNASNCSVTGAYRRDATIRNNVISSNLNNLAKHSFNDKRRKKNSPSNASNLSTASFERTPAFFNSVLDRRTPPTYSDKKLGSNRKLVFKKELGSNEELGCNDFAPSCPPIETSDEASGDSRKEEVSKQNEKPAHNVSEDQIRTQGRVNTRERRCKRPTGIQLKPEKQISPTTTLKYTCADCGRRTRTKCLMRNHILVCHLKKPVMNLKCGICEKSFKTRSRRADHMILHSRDRLFECNMCGARFRWRCNMARHRRLHTKWDLKGSIKIK